MTNLEIKEPATEELEQLQLEAAPLIEAAVEHSKGRHTVWRTLGSAALRTYNTIKKPVAVAAIVTAPFAGAIEAIDHLPAHLSAAGAAVTVDADFNRSTIEGSSALLPLTYFESKGMAFGPKTIGANVTFNYDSANFTDGNGGFDLGKIETVAKDFASPGLKDKIANASKNHFLHAGLLGAGGVMAAESGLLLCRRRQRTKLDKITPNTRDAVQDFHKTSRRVGNTVVALMYAGLLVHSGGTMLANNHPAHIAPDPALEAIGIHNIGLSGPGQPLIDMVVTKAVGYVDKVNNFYTAETKNFDAAFAEKYGPFPPNEKNIYFVVFIDDLQGENGPTQVAAEAAKKYGAKAIFVLGDTTATGSPYETYEFDELHKYAGHIPVNIGRAHHDPKLGDIQHMVKGYKNFQVATNRLATIGGNLYVVAINAPDIVALGNPGVDTLVHPDFPGETVDQANQQLAQQVIDQYCTSDKTIGVVVHEKQIGNAIAKANCPSITWVADGRSYDPLTPINYGTTIEFTNGSGGGHGSDTGVGAYGIIGKDATFRVVKFDAVTNKPISSVLVTLDAGPNTGVQITDETIQYK